MRTIVVWMTAVATVAAIVACGADVSGPRTTGGAGGAAGTTTGTGGNGIGGGGGIAGDAGVEDAASDAPSDGSVSDAGLFDCMGCACDGATHYCTVYYAGAKVPPSPPPPDAAACTEVDAGPGCAPLPAACAPSPSCQCLDIIPGGFCQCSELAEGLLVECFLP